MQTKKLPLLIILTVALASTPCKGASGYESQLQIKKFRFNHHSGMQYERLVLEFSQKGAAQSRPSVRLNPSANRNESVVIVENATLVGAIPESAINDSFTRKSLYMGPISVNTDTRSGFNLRTFTKSSNTVVDAFWLANPARLIIDVFPRSSQRAAGPAAVSGRHVANASVSSKHSTKWKAEAGKTDAVLCFPASSQVKANIGFQRMTQFQPTLGMTIDNTFNLSTIPSIDGIVCYPKGAQVMPTLHFQPKSNPFQSRLELDQTGSFLSADRRSDPVPLAPSVSPTESALNSDADLALSTPDDSENRKVQSTDPTNYDDNFNKNAPPPSLGKRLIPPDSKEAQSAILANPGGLLPPLPGPR